MNERDTSDVTRPARRRARSTAAGRLRAVGVAVGLLAAALVVSSLSAVVVVLLTPLPASETDPAGLVVLAVASQLGLLVVGLGYVRRWRPAVRFAVPTRGELGATALAVLAMLAAATGLAAVVSRRFPETGSVFDGLAATPALLLVLAVVSVLLVAPAEELLFRGAIQGRLRRSFGPVGAVVGASALFASVHLVNYTGPLPGVLAFVAVIGAVSLVLGWLYEHTGNLAAPVLAHGLYNAVLFVAGYATLVGS